MQHTRVNVGTTKADRAERLLCVCAYTVPDLVKNLQIPMLASCSKIQHEGWDRSALLLHSLLL